MSASGWQRWAPWSGIAFVVLLVVGFGLASSSPSSTDPARNFVTFWSDSANRLHLIMGAYLLVAAAIAFVGFAAGLWSRVEAAGGSPTWLVLTAGLFAGLLALVGVLFALDAGNITFGGSPVPPAEILRETSQVPYPILFVPGAISAAGFLVAASVLGSRHAVLPRWLTILGLVTAVLMLGAAAFFPFLALPLWVLVASISLLALDRRRVAGRPPVATAGG